MICRSRWPRDAAASTYVSSTTASDPTMKRVAYQSAIRSPNAREDRGRRSCSGSKDIAHTTHRVQNLVLERSIDLFPQPAHQHVHDVRLRVEAVIPDVRQN